MKLFVPVLVKVPVDLHRDLRVRARVEKTTLAGLILAAVQGSAPSPRQVVGRKPHAQLPPQELQAHREVALLRMIDGSARGEVRAREAQQRLGVKRAVLEEVVSASQFLALSYLSLGPPDVNDDRKNSSGWVRRRPIYEGKKAVANGPGLPLMKCPGEDELIEQVRAAKEGAAQPAPGSAGSKPTTTPRTAPPPRRRL